MNRAAITALIAIACLGVPAAASASDAGTTISRRADRTALNAYATYLQSLAAGKATGVQADQTFAASTASTCYRALEPIASSQTVPPGAGTALTSIGDEISADARLEFFASATTPMSELSSTLATVRWGTSGPATIVRRFLTAQQALMALAPSNLCGDANSVASQAGASQVAVPPATQAFLQTYASASGAANSRLSAFVKLLDSYATSSDRAVAAKIDLMAAKVDAIVTAAISAGTKSLFHALGIPAAATATSVSPF